MQRFAIFFLVIGLSACAGMESPPPPAVAGEVEVAVEVVQDDRYPREVSFPGGVRGLAGLVYWNPAGYRPLALDLYLPPAMMERPPAGFPLVIRIHGGGWMSGDKHRSGPFVDFPGVLASVAARGYVVASIDYRLSAEARFPAQAHDVKAAIRWLRMNAATYGIDPARAVTWGESAGGHLAALAALSCDIEALKPVAPAGDSGSALDVTAAPVSDCVQGSVAWSGVFDMSTIAPQANTVQALSREAPEAPEWRLLGCFADQCRPEQLASASPAAYVDPTDPPMLLIVGDQDATIPFHQTLEMAKKLRSSGVRHELIVLRGVGHGFIGKTPDQTRDANRKALAETIRFVDRTIGPGSPVLPNIK